MIGTKNASAVLDTGRVKKVETRACLGGCGARVSGQKLRCGPCQDDQRRIRQRLYARKAGAK